MKDLLNFIKETGEKLDEIASIVEKFGLVIITKMGKQI